MITLSTLEQATAQEVFDQVATHLLTQKEKSKHNRCLYKDTVHDRKCAAGCLIGDDEYSPDMEGRNWVCLAAEGVVPKSHTRLVSDLQRVHDNFPVRVWPLELISLAKYYGLGYDIFPLNMVRW